MAGDHGVYEEGVTSNPQEVTFAQTLSFAKGLTGVCVIGKVTGAKIVAVDVGIKEEVPMDAGIILSKIKKGTDNMAKGPAMSREEAIKSIEVGIEIANEEIQKGVNLLGTGEMGIGNTTPSTAILSVLKNCDPLEITGRGAGLGIGGIEHKAAVIRKAIEINKPDCQDAIDVLAKSWCVKNRRHDRGYACSGSKSNSSCHRWLHFNHISIDRCKDRTESKRIFYHLACVARTRWEISE